MALKLGSLKKKGSVLTAGKRGSQAKLMRDKRENVRDIGAIPAVKNASRKSRCKSDLAKFLVTYFPAAFFTEFSAKHLEYIEKLQSVILSSGLVSVAMPRGSGKTTIAERAALWGLLYGHVKFGAMVGAEGGNAKSMLNSIQSELENNELLLEDFPEVVYPVRQLEGINQRCQGQLCQGKATAMKMKGDMLVLPTISGSAASGGVLICKGLMSAARGLKYTTASGEVLRPEFLLVDDPQTDESAKSETKTKGRRNILTKGLLGLEGQRRRMGVLVTCTVIEPGDLADQILGEEELQQFVKQRVGFLGAMPEEVELWERYKDLYKSCMREARGGDVDYSEATAFYVANRAKMDRGAVEHFPARRGGSDVSSLQYAYNRIVEMGEDAFFAEYMNQPRSGNDAGYELTEEVILNRLNGLGQLEVPMEGVWLVGHADVNLYGLNYVIRAVGSDGTSWVVDYGCWLPGRRKKVWTERDGITRTQGVYSAVWGFCEYIESRGFRRVNGDGMRLTGLLVDCGFEMDAVFKAVEKYRQRGLSVFANRGWGSSQYKQTKPIGLPGDNWHRTEFRGKGQVYSHNADCWRMRAQRQWLLPPGAPGGISVWGSKRSAHLRLAEEICAEKLQAYEQKGGYEWFKWGRKPGVKNDLLDALTGSLVAGVAAGADLTGARTVKGAGQAGQGQARPAKSKKRRKISIK